MLPTGVGRDMILGQTVAGSNLGLGIKNASIRLVAQAELRNEWLSGPPHDSTVADKVPLLRWSLGASLK